MSTRSLVSFLVVLAAAVTLPVPASAQILSVSPQSVSAQGTQGGSIPSQTVSISNTGGKRLKWSIPSPNASWFSVSPTSGGGNGTVTVSFSSAVAGSFSGLFQVTSNGGTSTVAVNLTVTAAQPPPPTGLTISGPTSVAVGQTAQYTAYANGQLLTTGVWWYTHDSTATIDHATGILTGVSGGTANVQFDYNLGGTLTASPPYPVTVGGSSPLVVTCPANMSVASPNGSAVAVSYSVTTSGGVAPVTWSGTPASGSLFPVGTTAVAVTARSSDGQTATCGFSVTVSYTAPIAPPGVGPQSTIVCPAGAVDIFPGTNNIQTMVNLYGNGTTFCLRAGTFSVTSSITPKTGDTFVGEYGAVLDGSGWTTGDPSYTQAAFRAHNQDIDYVTIRNLVIRNMPQRGIHTYYMYSDHWTIEYNEIASNRDIGIHFSPNFVIRNNYIHHNAYSGFMGYAADNSVVEGNEIAYNGREQKVAESANVAVRNNFVHHNAGTGIWFDSNNTGAVIEGNRVEDNAMMGIYYEISSDAIIRNNTVKRSQQAGVMLSVSKNVQIYNNVLEGNFRGILYFLNCPSLGTGPYDLTNNTAHDNTITVGTQSGAWANALTYNACTSTQLAPYLNGSKNLTFSYNTYRVPFLNAWYWVWGDAAEYWNQWLALPQDATSTVSQY